MPNWTFDLSPRCFGPEEREIYADDLAALGADVSVLAVWSATLAASSTRTRPLVLRASLGERPVGAAMLMLCRDWGRSFFGRPLLRRAARLGPPIWYWERTGMATDAMSCPGLVAPGIERAAFVEKAMDWLSRRFLLGCQLTPGVTQSGRHQLSWPGLGVSTRQPPWASTELLAEHRNLGRKVRRFANRSGRICTATGPMPTAWRAALLATYALERPLNPPYIELYPRMIERQWDLVDDRLIHLVALIGDEPVGYHSFWHTGRRLVLLSGALSRPPGGTTHAYENLLLASLDVARDRDCAIVEYGATVNPVKSALLDPAPTTMTFVSRWPGVLAATRLLLPRSALSQSRIAAVTTAVGG